MNSGLKDESFIELFGQDIDTLLKLADKFWD